MSKNLEKIGTNAKIAFQNKISNKKKNKVLNHYIQLIKKNQNKILFENTKDIKIAKSKKLKENLIKRLALNNDKISSIIKSIKTMQN
jgi:Gamma-glutamyl phosphate reductase